MAAYFRSSNGSQVACMYELTSTGPQKMCDWQNITLHKALDLLDKFLYAKRSLIPWLASLRLYQAARDR